MSSLSRIIFLKKDSRKIKSLFELLINENLMPENIYEHTARTLVRKNFEKALIFTGFPKGNTYETDGPIGAFVLANLLHDYLNIPTVNLVVPNSLRERIHNICKTIIPDVNLIAIEEIGTDHQETTLAVSIEVPGPNKLGIFHHMNGKDLNPSFLQIENPSSFLGKFWLGFDKQNSDSITIGIGDGGNELGLGKYAQQIQEIIPYGNVCSCPCNAGITSSIPSKITLLGNTSNWAAFALASAFKYTFTYETYRLWLSELNKVGIVDGVTGEIAPTVDGIDPLLEKKILPNFSK